jgi:hypothetical protein
MERDRYAQDVLRSLDMHLRELGEERPQGIGQKGLCSVFELMDRLHQGPFIQVRGEGRIIKGPFPQTVLTHMIFIHAVKKGRGAYGAEGRSNFSETGIAGLT